MSNGVLGRSLYEVRACVEAARACVDESKIAEYKKGIAKEEAKRRLFSQIKDCGGRIIIISKDGKEGYINKNSARKLVDSIRGSTIKNDFTAEQHYAAAADIVNLYKNSIQVLEHPDHKGRSRIESIDRFVAPLYGDNYAFITGKVIENEGRKIHSLELTEIGKLEGTIDRAKNPHILATNNPTINIENDF